MSGTAPPPADDAAAGPADAGLEQLAINVVRGLAMDAPRAASSGHSGTAMALAPLAHVLWTRIMRHDPADPAWPDRDRFVLSNGHALDPPLLDALSHRLRPDARRPEGLPAVGQQDARPPRAPAHRRGRGDDRPARPGVRQRRRHGSGGAVLAHEVRLRRRRPPHVRHRRRRLPGGRDLARGGVTRRPPPARPARLRLRRQPHLDRRTDRAVVHRPRPRTVRRLRLGRRRRRRDRQRHDRARSRGTPGDGRRGQAVADRPAQPYRLAVAEPDGHGEGPRRPVPTRRDPGDEGAPRAAAGRDVLGAGRGARPLSGVRRARPGPAGRVAGPVRRLERRPGGVGRGVGRSGPARLGGEAADVRRRRRAGDAQGGERVHQRDRRPAARPRRRRGRPDRQHRRQARRRGAAVRRAPRRPAGLLRDPRARHGRGDDRDGPPRRCPAGRRHVLRLQRLHARCGAVGRAVPGPRRLLVDARLRRPRRGRPDPPADRAAGRPPGDARAPGDPAGRRQRDGAGLADGGEQ